MSIAILWRPGAFLCCWRRWGLAGLMLALPFGALAGGVIDFNYSIEQGGTPLNRVYDDGRKTYLIFDGRTDAQALAEMAGSAAVMRDGEIHRATVELSSPYPIIPGVYDRIVLTLGGRQAVVTYRGTRGHALTEEPPADGAVRLIELGEKLSVEKTPAQEAPVPGIQILKFPDADQAATPDPATLPPASVESQSAAPATPPVTSLPAATTASPPVPTTQTASSPGTATSPAHAVGTQEIPTPDSPSAPTPVAGTVPGAVAPPVPSAVTPPSVTTASASPTPAAPASPATAAPLPSVAVPPAPAAPAAAPTIAPPPEAKILLPSNHIVRVEAAGDDSTWVEPVTGEEVKAAKADVAADGDITEYKVMIPFATGKTVLGKEGEKAMLEVAQIGPVAREIRIRAPYDSSKDVQRAHSRAAEIHRALVKAGLVRQRISIEAVNAVPEGKVVNAEVALIVDLGQKAGK